MEFDRIVRDDHTLGGRPRIRGTRIAVSLIMDLLDQGVSIEEVLADYPGLRREGVLQALRYAASVVDGGAGE